MHACIQTFICDGKAACACNNLQHCIFHGCSGGSTNSTKAASAPLDVTLLDEHGATWKAVCLQPPNGQAFLTGTGWKGFAEAAQLQLGDQLLLAANNAVPGSVSIRVNQAAARYPPSSHD